jgi:uncharacterized protein
MRIIEHIYSGRQRARCVEVYQNTFMNEAPLNPPPVNPTPPNAAPAMSDRSWNIFTHLSAVIGFVIPFGNIIGPLVIWLIKRDQLPSVAEHGREAVNFQISMSIYTILAAISIFAFVGILLLPVVILLNLVLTIVAAVKASNGEFFRYPLTIRFVN